MKTLFSTWQKAPNERSEICLQLATFFFSWNGIFQTLIEVVWWDAIKYIVTYSENGSVSDCRQKNACAGFDGLFVNIGLVYS